MPETLTLTGPSGQPFTSHLFLPPNAERAPAVVLLHEWYGLNEETDRMARQFAAAGFVVAAVDVYGGKVATNGTEAFALMQALNGLEAAGLVRVVARSLLEHPRANGRVGVVGFCMGGALTFVCACQVPEASAFVPFYGIPRADHVDWSRTHGPIQAHFAKVDASADPAKAEAIRERVVAHGARCELHLYDGGHAFMRASDAAAFHPASAALAFERATAFFRHELADGVAGRPPS